MPRPRSRSGPRPSPPPLDAGQLERLALRYVERFATTRGKLNDYLRRKLRECGWAGEEEPAPEGVAERLAALGYIDDRGYAASKAASMGRRGLGRSRVMGALRAAGVDADDSAAIAPSIEAQALDAALAFARRRRLGPFAAAPADRPLREKQIAAMARAGHGFALARRIVEAAPGAAIEGDDRFGDGSGDESC